MFSVEARTPTVSRLVSFRARKPSTVLSSTMKHSLRYSHVAHGPRRTSGWATGAPRATAGGPAGPTSRAASPWQPAACTRCHVDDGRSLGSTRQAVVHNLRRNQPPQGIGWHQHLTLDLPNLQQPRQPSGRPERPTLIESSDPPVPPGGHFHHGNESSDQ